MNRYTKKEAIEKLYGLKEEEKRLEEIYQQLREKITVHNRTVEFDFPESEYRLKCYIETELEKDGWTIGGDCHYIGDDYFIYILTVTL